MQKLENVIMFTGPTCGACKAMKQSLELEGYVLGKEVDISTDEGSAEAAQYRVRSLPTFINPNSMEQRVGTLGVQDLIELN